MQTSQYVPVLRRVYRGSLNESKWKLKGKSPENRRLGKRLREQEREKTRKVTVQSGHRQRKAALTNRAAFDFY